MFTINSNMIYNQVVIKFLCRYISILAKAIQNMLQLFRNTFCHWSNTLQMLVGRRGLEPRTTWLKVR